MVRKILTVLVLIISLFLLGGCTKKEVHKDYYKIPEKVTLTFKVDDKIYTSFNIGKEELIDQIPTPHLKGTIFKGWVNEEHKYLTPSTRHTSDTNYYAIFETDKIHITISDYDRQAYHYNILHGEQIDTSNIVKPGYKLIGLIDVYTYKVYNLNTIFNDNHVFYTLFEPISDAFPERLIFNVNFTSYTKKHLKLSFKLFSGDTLPIIDAFESYGSKHYYLKEINRDEHMLNNLIVNDHYDFIIHPFYKQKFVFNNYWIETRECSQFDIVAPPGVADKENLIFHTWVDDCGREVDFTKYVPLQNKTFHIKYKIPHELNGKEVYDYCIEKDTITLNKYLGNKSIVYIPTEIDGLKVTTLGDACFKENKFIKKVYIGNNITSIGSHLFEGCPELTYVQLPNTITEVPAYCFYKSNNFHLNVQVPPSVKIIGKKAFAYTNSIYIDYGSNTEVISNGAYAFSNVNYGYLPQSLKIIDDYAFASSALRVLSLGLNVEYIGDGAFVDTSIMYLTIPQNVKEIGFSAFFGCSFVHASLYNTTKINKYTFDGSKLKYVTVFKVSERDNFPKGWKLNLAGIGPFKIKYYKISQKGE